MKALAIHYGHNCTVGLSIDGQIVCLLSEERICRLKNAVGFPFQALRHVVDTWLDGDIANADHIGIVDGTGRGAAWLKRNGIEPRRYLDYYWKDKEKIWSRATSPVTAGVRGGLRTLLHPVISGLQGRGAREEVLAKTDLDFSKVAFFDHHTSHAASAAYFSPVMDGGDWLIFTLDAEGDGLSSTVSLFRNGRFERISENNNVVSLGYLFAETTAYLGMKSNEHEFKLMGMAPYAEPEQVDRLAKQLEALMWLKSDGSFASSVPSWDFLPHLMRLYAFERFDVISGAIQKLTEDLVCRWVEFWVAKTGVSRVGVSGGVFMNVKAAKKLSESDCLETLFVVPSASDESLPIGVLWQLARNARIPVRPVEDLYLGRGFDRAYVEAMIVRDNLIEDFSVERFTNDDALAERVAGLLADDVIVARCCGREEWGARALGNRSILCNPSSFQNIERLNSKIKCRDFWMPFTPSVLDEDLSKYALNPRDLFAPYMAITFDSTPLARKHLAAAVHPRDFTMRPQAVTRNWNPEYHRLISAFRAKTGIGGVLNTSFNLHGEPNVSTPEDAIRTVRNSGLEYVLIGHALFRKRMG